MLRPEDILAARTVASKLPQQRDALWDCLEDVRCEKVKGSFLSELIGRRLLDERQANHVSAAVEAQKRERCLKIFARELNSLGVAATNIQQALARIGTQGTVVDAGQALVGAGLLDAHLETTVRARAEQQLAVELGDLMTTLTPPGGYPLPGARPRPVSAEGKVPAKIMTPAPPEESWDDSETASLTEQEMSDMLGRPVSEEGRVSDQGPTLSPIVETITIPGWVDVEHERVGEWVGPFQIVAFVGGGSMGVVYLAIQKDQPGRRVALKLLPRDAGADARGRFKREILANSFFSHPRALDVYDAGASESGEQFLAIEFFEGLDLGKILAQRGKLPPKVAVWIAVQVLETLAAAHAAGVVHRDVKPENILVGTERWGARLMDFGIALLRDLGEFGNQVFQTMGRAITGTPAYVSPEQAGGLPVGPPSDVYSLGLVLYQMLTGQMPFRSETPHGFITCHMVEDPVPMAQADPAAANLPPELVALVDRMLDKDADVRPRDAEGAAALRELIPRLHS